MHKFISLDLIESLSHSSGFIKTKNIDNKVRWLKFLHDVVSQSCSLFIDIQRDLAPISDGMIINHAQVSIFSHLFRRLGIGISSGDRNKLKDPFNRIIIVTLNDKKQLYVLEGKDISNVYHDEYISIFQFKTGEEINFTGE